MDGLALYLLFLIPPLVFGLAVQWWLKKTFATYSNVPVAAGMTGAQVARSILDRNGLGDVPVELSPGGALSDHYDPRKKALFLSEPVYAPATVAAAAVAAHETGHALQDSRGYVPLKLRSAMYPAVAFASNAWIWLLIIGALLQAMGLIAIALVIYSVAVLFHIVTLPVEFNASRRASGQLRELGIVGAGAEAAGVNSVLKAAALTYVAGALAAITQLLYYALVFFGDDGPETPRGVDQGRRDRLRPRGGDRLGTDRAGLDPPPGVAFGAVRSLPHADPRGAAATRRARARPVRPQPRRPRPHALA